MNIYLLQEYINRLKKEDINNFALKQGITLEKYELDIIYKYIKEEEKKIIYGNSRGILDEIKEQVKPLTYSKIENLYMKFKDRI